MGVRVSCGCNGGYSPDQIRAAKASMCAVCRVPEVGDGGERVCRGVPVELRVLGAQASEAAMARVFAPGQSLPPSVFFCPLGRHPAKRTIGGETVWATHWMGVRWVGVPWPVRLWVFVRSPRHPRPGRVPCVSVAVARVVIGMQRAGLWPRRLRWFRRIGSSHARLPGCGCIIVLKRRAVAARAWAAGVWARATAETWGARVGVDDA